MSCITGDILKIEGGSIKCSGQRAPKIVYLAMSYEFSTEKNEELINERGVSFQNIIEAINNGRILLNIKHPKQVSYPNQWMYIIEYKNYTYSVPYVLDGDNYFLKTIFPNRKYMYLLKEGDQDE